MNRSIRYSLLLLLFVLVDAGGVCAQTPAGPSNEGREFLLSFPVNWDLPDPNKRVRFYISSRVATQVRISTAGSQIQAVNVTPGGIATVDLPTSIGQPYSRTPVAPIPLDQIYTNKGVRVESDEPIVLTAMNYVRDTDDGILALPTAALGRDYVVASAADAGDGQYRFPSQYVITAAYDNTVVTIINSRETHGHLAGETVTVALMKGDVYAASSQGLLEDLTGTTITSSRPIAVLSGVYCAYLPGPAGRSSLDYLVEMLPPVTSWGKVYHLLPIAGRAKSDLIRIFAGAPKAMVIMNGEQLATLNTKGGEEGSGWLQVVPTDPVPMQFISDKPIYVAQYKNSESYDKSGVDPFFMGVPPVEQYQTAFMFMTPGLDYSVNYVNLIADSSGWNDIEIATGMSGEWKNLRATTGATTKSFSRSIDGVRYIGVTFQIEAGLYRLRGTKPFGGNLYGFSGMDSYGYPLSAAGYNLSVMDTVAPRITFTQTCTGRTSATVTDGPVVDAWRSNLSTIELDPASFNYRFDPRPGFEPGSDWLSQFDLAVVDPTRDARAILVAGDGRGNVTRDTISYTAFDMTMAEDPTDFGSMNRNISPLPTRSMILRNLADRPVVIKDLLLKFGNRGFRVVGPTGEFTLSGAGTTGDTRTIVVEFAPTVSGSFVDSIGVRDECGPHMLALLKANVAMPRIQVIDVNFGSWPIDDPTPAERIIKIRNISTDGGVLIVTGVAGGPSQPLIFATPNGYPAFPLRLMAGSESDPIRVTFDPAAPIAYIDSIHFAHNAGSGAANDSIAVLNGTGTTTTTEVETGSTPGLALGPIAPTPTDGWAMLSYTIPVASMVEITLVDATGRTVGTLLGKTRIEQGSHMVRFDVSALPAGSYFCRMTVGEKILVHPVVVR